MKKLVPVFIWLLFVVPNQARIITVDDDGPADFNNIQAAINDSNDGDVIEVKPGTYTGDGNQDIDFGGKAITIRSTNPNSPDIVAATIIDCNGMEEEPHRGFYFHNNEDSNSVVDGFTITNGYASASASYLERNGGAIFCANSNPTIANCAIIGNTARSGGGICFYKCYSRIPSIISCTFVDNRAGFAGGGVASYDSSPILNNCIFSGNFAGGLGGGIGHIDFGSPTLTKCRLIGNAATYMGGGIYGCFGPTTNCTITGNWAGESGGGMDYCDEPITNCVITGNWAGVEGGGMHHCSGPITNCIITGNSAEYWGGGMLGCDGPITNCTITGNWAGDQGGGLASCYGPITNCTITDNWAQNHGGGLTTCDDSFTNCIIWGNSNEQIYRPLLRLSIIHSDIQDGWPGQGNIDADPCFVDPGYWDPNETPEDANDDFWVEGDYHLLVDSPCIDVGDPNYPYDPNETDLDGTPRIFGNRIDMGAYEYSPTIQTEARIVPRTINMASKGNWITCYIWLPEQYNVADIEPNSVILENEIQAASLSVDEQDQVAIARFSREEIQAILSVGQVELAITGELTDGTVFEGTVVIRVIDNGGGKPIK
ncbi:MAG: hypothetical protein FVQ85_08510 [Planctomycetes bacterium]|nr:hypothetical protein [Planctomycetota bacterium]